MPGKSYVALGLMSGTSLDGVDAAFLETDGENIIAFGPSVMIPYTSADKETLAQATQAALRWQFEGARPNSFFAAEAVIHRAHIGAVKAAGAANPDWAAQLDMIGFHGQTVLHHPPQDGKNGQTLQLGSGQVLADEFGLPVYFDFRSSDVYAGGHGAPLAPIYHKALAEFSGIKGCAAVLNIGGVSNITLIDDEELLASDCGPGNGPLDNWMSLKAGLDYDKDGAISLRGTPHFALIDHWLWGDFFHRQFPKSADRYDFDVLGDVQGLSLEDGAASLSTFCSTAIAKAVTDIGSSPETVIVCGGGRHNQAILWMLAEHISAAIKTAEDMGWDGDAIEAEAFAYLAVRSKRGLPISFPMTTGVPEPMTGGRVAYPSIKRGSRGGT